ncbi:YybH family protein [Aspergillus neoniger CBS 115656]|uniref:NTF2-like protein n=1 Tax=Aspergillus neoniger (strain CBS 115656) TaxID=1448310 RepID=A0A318YAY8_ASPNB|nr:NTF2-like protein [Aspergillus neoniger CBS 115656]PYH31511.1 NTF2-like protein [Aspergillus neoniger CBS 115656]
MARLTLPKSLQSVPYEMPNPHLSKWGYPFLDRKATYKAKYSSLSSQSLLLHSRNQQAIMSPADADEISALLHAYGKALRSRNVDEAVALYTEDGVIMPPHFSASTGTEALRDSYTRIFATIQLIITFQIEEIVVMSPEWAFARTTAEGTKTILATQESEPHANQELFILRREHGKWLIARYAFSSMKPLVQNGIRRS